MLDRLTLRPAEAGFLGAAVCPRSGGGREVCYVGEAGVGSGGAGNGVWSKFWHTENTPVSVPNDYMPLSISYPSL